MKHMNLCLPALKRMAIILAIALPFISPAQEKQKEVREVIFKVAGNCNECKARIENAADIKGVKLAEWNAKTQTLKVVYRTDKVTESQIKKAVIDAGHDVGDQKADSTRYNKLPDCCKYRDKKCEK